MKGIFEIAQQTLKTKANKQLGIVFIEDIAEYIQTLRKNKYDSHIIVQGQNGTGKSYFMLALMKELAKYIKDSDFKSMIKKNIFYAFNETEDLIKALLSSEDQIFGIDEAKKFLHYKQSMTKDQIFLINCFEYARSKRNTIVSCTNDVRRLNNNYRNSKAQILIWFLDRMPESETRKIVSYGLVFIGLPSLEEEDKFLIDDITGVYNTEGLRVIAETKPTMIGYFLFENINKYLTDEEIEIYEELKKKGIEYSKEYVIEKMKQYEEKNISNIFEASLRKIKEKIQRN